MCVCVCVCVRTWGSPQFRWRLKGKQEEPPTSTNGYGLKNSLHIPWWKLPWIYHGTSLGSWGWLKAMELSIWITSCFPFRWKRWSHKVRIKAAITGQEVGRHVSREREGGKRYATSQHMSAAFAYCMPVAHKYCQYRVLCLKLGSMFGHRW